MKKTTLTPQRQAVPDALRKRVKHIVIIDDDAAILEALRLMFEMTLDGGGVEVDTSKTSDILFRFRAVKPDVILLDLRLSGEDGADIARLLKRHKSTRDIPIIMMSAHPSAERYMRESGADDFISKPFDISTMFEKVEKFISA